MIKNLQQSRTILNKNWLCFFRRKSELRSEILAPLILCAVLCCQKISSSDVYQLFCVFLVPVGVNALYRKLIVTIVNEKSQKYRETQKIIGLSNEAYLLGWMAFFYIRTLLVSFIFIIGFIICRDAFKILTFTQIVLSEIINNFAIISFNFMLSAFFQRPQFAVEFCAIIQIFLPFLPFFVKSETSSGLIYLMGMLPQTNGALVFFCEFNWDIRNKVQVNTLIGQQVGNMFLYLLLFLYFDQVLPNEFGIRKHPLFFIKNLFKSSKHKKQVEGQQPLLTDDVQLRMEADEVCSAKFYEPIEGNWESTITIRQLTKSFGGFKAVDGISLNLYKSKILCLLGHNGAGKTTTLSLLTGLIEKTAGQVSVYGLDLNQDIEQIRQSTGLCSQKDILYDTMTVEEHLRFVANIKQVNTEALEKELEDILQKCCLETERHKQAGILSGGFKRKLSLAMSLMGGSKVVYLDEPTSGLDPVSRQSIWGILEQIRSEDRTIILTTHFLDEADRLADRIGIMSRGKLLAMGTANYVKKQFGEGYQLIMSPREQNPSEQYLEDYQVQVGQVRQQTLDLIKGSKEVDNNMQQKNTLTLLLPFDQQHLFPKLCTFIEQQDKINQAFTLNTLEDAFIKIGLEEDKYFENEEDRHVHNFKEKVEQPKCLANDPQQYFSSQFTALFLRKVYITYRDFTLLLSYALPSTLAIIGVIVCKFLEKSFGKSSSTTLVQSIIFNNILGFAYTLNVSVFISTAVMERENRLKYALNVMGCKIVPYWLATLAFDYLLYMFTVLVLVVVMESEQLTFATDHIGKFIMSMALYGLNIGSMSYAAGFMFTSKNTATKLYPILLYIFFYSLPWGFVNGFSQVSLALSHFFEVFFIIISPPFAWSRSLLVFYGNVGQLLKPTPVISSFQLLMAIMAGQAVLFFTLTLILDYKVQKVDTKKNAKKGKVDEDRLNASILQKSLMMEEKAEIEKEKQQVLENIGNYGISLQEVEKTYPNGFKALRGLTAGVERGEMMGLLGPNGAGKSTTFNLLTSAQKVSAGKVLLKQQNIYSQNQPVFKHVGICPQTDCIWDNLTPVEHLYLFGRLKGLKGQDLKQAVDYFINVMQLTSYVKTKAINLSGGNKRKLCVSIALIGGPDLLFFDEPSSGLDPIAKRFLWNSLKDNLQKKNSSIVLTTHSMEEAETLCNKIGILINGRFICFGTVQNLKHKYGGGFNVQVKGNQDELESIQKRLEEHYQQVKLLPGEKDNYCQFQVNDNVFRYSQVFQLLNQCQQQQIIQDYSIIQSSLEQIFLFFSKFQHKEDDEV